MRKGVDILRRIAERDAKLAAIMPPEAEEKDCPECQGTGNFYRHDEDGDFLSCDHCRGEGVIKKEGKSDAITRNLKEISERVRLALDALTLPGSIEERPARAARLSEAERASVDTGRGGMRKFVRGKAEELPFPLPVKAAQWDA